MEQGQKFYKKNGYLKIRIFFSFLLPKISKSKCCWRLRIVHCGKTLTKSGSVTLFCGHISRYAALIPGWLLLTATGLETLWLTTLIRDHPNHCPDRLGTLHPNDQ